MVGLFLSRIRDLDEELAELAKAVSLDYFERGESEELLSFAQKFSQMVEPVEWWPREVEVNNTEVKDDFIPVYAGTAL